MALGDQIFNAVDFARSDKMDLSIGVIFGLSIQVALVVAPGSERRARARAKRAA